MRTAARCAIAVGACTLALVLGCASDKGMSESKGDKNVVAMNKNCLMQTNEAVDPAVHETYKGQVVGFCCTKCQAGFDKMTDAQKDAKVKSAMAAR